VPQRQKPSARAGRRCLLRLYARIFTPTFGPLSSLQKLLKLAEAEKGPIAGGRLTRSPGSAGFGNVTGGS